MKHQRIYRALLDYGFSPPLALKIKLDARRGHDGALITVKLAVARYRAARHGL